MKSKSHNIMSILFRVTVFQLICLIALLCFGCDEEETEEDLSIGEITVYNLPAKIPVFGSNPEVSYASYKIYVNASNYQSEDEDPAAKGVAKFSDGKEENGKYSVTIKLLKPNDPNDPNNHNDDPNFDTGAWKGTAKYFSITIAPEFKTDDKDNIIWMKGGTTLNIGKKNQNWEEGLINFRELMENGSERDKEFYANKTRALYDGIIVKDSDIKTKQ